ncbi:MAG: tetratricopeptide repeat protein [Nitrospirae bacterium]|nr:tetratricopeptide repeat protein [Nitrospirota bacterium]
MLPLKKWFEAPNLKFYVISVIFVSFAVYFNALFNGFVYDDIGQVVENRWLKDIKNIPTIFTASAWSFLPENEEANYYRPLTHIIYLITYHIFGLQAWGFHLINIIFHSGVSVLVFVILLTLQREIHACDSVPFFLPSFISALLFATHPIHTEAVSWVAGLPDISYSFFFLLSLYLYLRSEGLINRHYLLSVISYFLAALCKEPALTLLGVIIIHDHIFEKTDRRPATYLQRYIPYLIVAIIYLILRFNALGGFAPLKPEIRLSTYGYIINAFPLFSQYVKALILPINLNVFHVFHPIFSIFEMRGIISAGVTAVFVTLCCLSLWKNRMIFFSLLIMVLPLLPVMYIPAVGENVFAERYLYLPSFGFVMLIAVFLSSENINKRVAGLRWALLIPIILIFIYSMSTISRNAVWKNNFILFTDTALKSPEAGLPHSYLGTEFMEKGQVDEAIEKYKVALKFDPDSIEVHNNLGNAYDYKGVTDKAIEQYEIALKLNPLVAATNYNLGIAYGKKGLLDKAVEHFSVALDIDPDNADAHYNLGYAYELKGRVDEADKHYAIAQRLREGE